MLVKYMIDSHTKIFHLNSISKFKQTERFLALLVNLGLVYIQIYKTKNIISLSKHVVKIEQIILLKQY